MKINQWFTAIVENINDPMNAGRIQIRCYEYHSLDTKEIPTADLPWAFPMMPLTSAGTGGVGTSPTGLQVGSWVFGFFRDPDNQDPFIIGCIPGVTSMLGQSIPSDATSKSIGVAYTAAVNTAQYSNGSPVANGANTSTMDNPANGVTNNSIERFVSIAQFEVGKGDQAKYWQAIGSGDAGPYCAVFVCWAIKEAGLYPDEVRPKLANALGFATNWVPNVAGPKGLATVQSGSITSIARGDIWTLHRGNPSSGLGHVGIALGPANAEGVFESLEGNSTGGKVTVNKRRLSTVAYRVILTQGVSSGTSPGTAPPVDITNLDLTEIGKNWNVSTSHRDVLGSPGKSASVPGARICSLDFNASANSSVKGIELVYPANSSDFEKQMAFAYVAQLEKFFAEKGIPRYRRNLYTTVNSKSGGRVPTSKFFTEPFFAADTAAGEAIMKDPVGYARVLLTTLGKIDGITFIPPHRGTVDGGASGTFSGQSLSEYSFALEYIIPALQRIKSQNSTTPIT
jgi:hypothetical protein